jgi:signal transduction histidine kinase
MAAIGEMINNISHQWRQPLNSVGVLIQQIGLTHELGALSQEQLDVNITKAMDIVQHMSQTIDDFRNFFAPDKEKSSFNVDQIVNKMIHIVEDDFRNNRITIEVSITEDLDIYSYPNEFSQVIFNILMNARDAFLERKVDQARVILCSWKENGRTVVTITDNAGGIKQENLDKIFDAYFTTKELGKGTGIGLFMSKTIIEKNMGGRFTVRNAGEGAEFRIEV